MAFLDALLGGLKGVSQEGTAKPPEPTVNFTGSGVTVTDDPTNGQTSVNIPGGAANARIYVLPQAYGAVGNGVADDSTAFNSMIAANAGKDILVGNGTFKLSNNVTFNANQNVFFQNGAQLDIDSGKTLALGKVNANLTQQIFTGAGTVTVPANTIASPMWWGAKGDGATDDAPAFAQAIASGANLEIPAGTYKLNSNVTFDATKEVRFHAGAILDRGSAVLVNVNSHINASLGAQIFTPGYTISAGSAIAGFMVGNANAQDIFACWWGAKGDGSHDDTTAIQSALVAANQLIVSYYDGHGGNFGAPNARLLPGRHLISSTVEVQWGTSLSGSPGRTTFLTDGSGTLNLVRAAGNSNNIHNIVFERGLSHIIVHGASAVFGGNLGNPEGTGNLWINNCAHRHANAPTILQDTTQVGENRSSSVNLIVTNFDFDGACFLWGTFDGGCFKDGTLIYDPTTVSLTDTSGVPLACFNTGDALTFDNIEAVPVTSSRGCWIQGNGSFYVNAFRFGGEAVAVIVRTRGTGMQWGSYPLAMEDLNANIQIHNSPLASLSGVNAFEFYGRMPATIDVISPSAFSGGVNTPLITSGDLGIYVDSATISLADIASIGAGASYKFIGYRSISAIRWRYGSSFSDTTGTDITKYLRNLIVGDGGILPGNSSAPQNNLFLNGDFDVSQLTGGDLTGFSSTGTDTSTGYSLTVYTAGSDNAIFAWASKDATFTTGWGGSNAPAGEYTLSWRMKSNVSGALVVTQNTIQKAIIPYIASSDYEPYSFTFYHDGSTNEVLRPTAFSIASGAVISAGLFAIHPGSKAHPYTFPLDSLSAPTTNTTVKDKTQSVYWASASPSGGTYKAGDIVWNSSPSAGAPIGWFCEVGGTPGTFQPFGGSATSSVLGQIELNTDLGGSASAPTVVQLTGSGGIVAVPGTELNLTGSAFVNLGASASIQGATGSFVAIGGTPAASGSFRASNNVTAFAVKAAGGGDMKVITTDGSDILTFGDSTKSARTFMKSLLDCQLQTNNGGAIFQFSTTGIQVFGSVPQMVFDGSANVQFTILAPLSDATPQVITVQSAASFSGASTHITGGNTFLTGGNSNATNGNGGFGIVGGGNKNGSGLNGGARLQIAGTPWLELLELASGANRVLSLVAGGPISTSQMPTNTGDGVIYISNAATAPTANSVGGGILYCEAGALKYRGTSGTVTTLGVA